MKIGDILICKKPFISGDIHFKVNEKYKIDDYHNCIIKGIRSTYNTHIKMTNISNEGHAYFTIIDEIEGYMWYDYFYTQDDVRKMKLDSI